MKAAATVALGIALVGLLVALIHALREPMRYLAVILARVMIGYAILYGVNAVTGWWWGIQLPLNPVTAAMTGVLGLPGFVVVLTLHQAWMG